MYLGDLVARLRYYGVTSLVLIALALGIPLGANTQIEASNKVFRVAFLAFGPRPVGTAAKTSPLVAFRQTLRERGYVEGENLILDERWAEARLNRLATLAAELVGLHPDIIVASGAGAVRATMRETQQIPIVIAGATDPVDEGLVPNLARPGGNVTGVSALTGRELEGKRLSLLKKAVPGARQVGVIMDSTSRLDPAPLRAAAHALGIELIESGETESPDEFRQTFAEMADSADAIYAPETPINVRQRRLIVDLALEHRLPTIYGAREYVEAGGLMSYGPNFSELFRRAAIYTDRILRGAVPGELPVEQPMHFELVVNINTAESLGLTFPSSILFQADDVIR